MSELSGLATLSESDKPALEGVRKSYDLAKLIYDELEGPIVDQDAKRQAEQWAFCAKLADKIMEFMK